MKLKSVLTFCVLFFCVADLNARTHHRPRSARHSAHFKHNFSFFSGDNNLNIDAYLNFENSIAQTTVSYPSLLLRYGILNRIELRAAVDLNSMKDETTQEIKTGLSPLQLGAKFQFNIPKKFFVPAFAITATVTIPKAATKNSAQTYWAPLLLLSAEQEFSKQLSFEYAGGLQWDADNFQRIWLGSLNMEYDFTDRFSFYSDFYLQKPEKDLIDLRADVGMNQCIANDIHFDFSMGAGLTSAAPQFFLSAGFQFGLRFKNRLKPAIGKPKSDIRL